MLLECMFLNLEHEANGRLLRVAFHAVSESPMCEGAHSRTSNTQIARLKMVKVPRQLW